MMYIDSFISCDGSFPHSIDRKSSVKGLNSNNLDAFGLEGQMYCTIKPIYGISILFGIESNQLYFM